MLQTSKSHYFTLKNILTLHFVLRTLEASKAGIPKVHHLTTKLILSDAQRKKNGTDWADTSSWHKSLGQQSQPYGHEQGLRSTDNFSPKPTQKHLVAPLNAWQELAESKGLHNGVVHFNLGMNELIHSMEVLCTYFIWLQYHKVLHIWSKLGYHKHVCQVHPTTM